MHKGTAIFIESNHARQRLWLTLILDWGIFGKSCAHVGAIYGSILHCIEHQSCFDDSSIYVHWKMLLQSIFNFDLD